MAPPIVWTAGMIARTMVPARERTEELATRLSDAVDPFEGVATAELDRAYRLAGLVLGNAAEAEDAVSAALERAWTRRVQLRDPAAFQAWFDRIVVNICRDQLRRRGRVHFIAIDRAPEAASADPFVAALDRDVLVRSLSRLDADERLVVVLHFWADLPLDAVADRCGWPVGTVKSRLHRALEVLRRDPAVALEGGVR